ncbi:MAG: DUF167 domain-containing protein [Deltaproteobacteria bacterium]|nr:DUF167 domain-containing protein [Deltaproteobacteria bacterium]
MDDYISNTKDGIILRVILHPRASKNGIVGFYRDMLKVQVTAPPVDDSANDMLVELLSDFLKIPKTKIKIMVGKTSRQKILKIDSDKFEKIKAQLESIVSPDKGKGSIRKNDDFDMGLE